MSSLMTSITWSQGIWSERGKRNVAYSISWKVIENNLPRKELIHLVCETAAFRRSEAAFWSIDCLQFCKWKKKITTRYFIVVFQNGVSVHRRASGKLLTGFQPGALWLLQLLLTLPHHQYCLQVWWGGYTSCKFRITRLLLFGKRGSVWSPQRAATSSLHPMPVRSIQGA